MPITDTSLDKFPQIPRDVGRAAGIETFAGHFHHRHRRFRRNAADFSPDEFVQHEIADDENAFDAARSRISRRRPFMKAMLRQLRMPPRKGFACDSKLSWQA